MSRYFDNYLKSPPLPEKSPYRRDVFIKIDAKYYSYNDCVILVKTGRELIYWRHFSRENFFNYLTVFRELSESNYNVVGVTSDWHGSVVGVVKSTYPNIPHQRCLVHLQRSCETFLTKNPQTEAGRELLELVKFLNTITNKDEANIWLLWLDRWESRYDHLVRERTYGTKDGHVTWWYTHRSLRRASRSLSVSIGNLFLYLGHDGLGKDTNGLESEFSHLKQKINMHRGLKMEKKISAVYWYVYFKNMERNL